MQARSRAAQAFKICDFESRRKFGRTVGEMWEGQSVGGGPSPSRCGATPKSVVESGLHSTVAKLLTGAHSHEQLETAKAKQSSADGLPDRAIRKVGAFSGLAANDCPRTWRTGNRLIRRRISQPKALLVSIPSAASELFREACLAERVLLRRVSREDADAARRGGRGRATGGGRQAAGDRRRARTK